MSNQGAVQAAQAILETFNASDWDGFRALSTTDAVYNELGTQRGTSPFLRVDRAGMKIIDGLDLEKPGC